MEGLYNWTVPLPFSSSVFYLYVKRMIDNITFKLNAIFLLIAWKIFDSVYAVRVGSIAAEYSDVGRYSHEDRCCREHDLCPNTLAPGWFIFIAAN